MKSSTVFLCNSLSNGGGERVFYELYKLFSSKGLFVTITQGEFEEQTLEDIVTLNSGKKRKNKFLIFFSFLKLILSIRPKIVHSHIHLANVFNVLSQVISKHESQVVIHGFLHPYLKSSNLFKRLYGKFLVFIYRIADKVIVVSKGMQEEMKTLKINSEVCYSFAKNVHFKYDDFKIITSNIENKTFKVLFMGRLHRLKRVSDIIRAVSLFDNVILDIVGAGNELENLKLLVNKLGLQERVNFLGFHKDTVRFLKDSNCLISASEYETFGLSIIEGLYSKLPVISSNCDSGPREIFSVDVDNGGGVIKKENFGMLYDVGDIEQLSECIHKVMASYSFYKPNDATLSKLEHKFSKEYFYNFYSNLIFNSDV